MQQSDDTGKPHVLTEEERQAIDRYTMWERRKRELYEREMPPLKRVRYAIEDINRRAWYSVFRRTLKNEPLRQKLAPQDVRSIFVMPIGDAIGDMIVALPVFHAIKRHMPWCHVGTLASSRNRTLIRSDNSIDATYTYKNKDDIRHYSELFRARRDGYDVVIDLHIPRMTEFGIACNVISPRGVKVCISHARKHMYGLLFNKLLPFDRDSMHLSQLGLVMLESVVDLPEPILQWESKPVITIDPATEAAMQQAISGKLEELGADWYVHFNPQARNPNREWGLDNAFAFAREFVDEYPRGALFFTASPVHRAEIEQHITQSGLPRVAFIPTSYDLQELAVLSNHARLIVTPDTSAIHFGTASGKPTLVLWSNPDYLPIEWVPLQTPSLNLAPDAYGDLVSTVPVQTVLAAARELLDGRWTSSATSFGLDPNVDPLYQADRSQRSIRDLLGESRVPRIFPTGSSESCKLFGSGFPIADWL